MSIAKFRSFSILVIVLLVSACGKALPEIEGFNREIWIGDKNGCEGNRARMRPSLEKEKDKLLALTEMQVVEMLGRPDQNELYKRNQKFYYYQLTPAASCGGASSSPTQVLILRFNAMGLVKEISIE